jgi:stearoyl-CoA desaturase (delta-9 desaturase)
MLAKPALTPASNRTERALNSLATLAPTIAFVVVAVVGWGHWLDLDDAIVFLSLWTLSGFGVTIGLHRLLTHRSFKTYKWLRYFWAWAGAMSLEGPLIQWVATHRKHHSFSDEEGDPHSPHGHGEGLGGAIQGLWHAHIGWLLSADVAAAPTQYAPDLMQDRGMRFISDNYLLWVVLSLVVVPGAFGFALGGTGAIGGAILWGGIMRVFWLHHTTYCINSLCHYYGRSPYATEDGSRNLMWLSLFTFGESWHNNHHAFPTSAFHGLRWYELDLSALIIKVMRRTHLAWDVIVPPSARLVAKRSH